MLIYWLYDRTGDVNVAVQGSNVPGQNGNFTVTPPSRRSRLARRGLISFIEDSFDSEWISGCLYYKLPDGPH